MPRPFDVKDFCIKALRRASYRCPMRTEAMKKARVSRGLYKCAICNKFIKVSELALDHKLPVIPVTGWDSLDGFASRLFCTVDGWQVLCKKPCHNDKTQAENAERRLHAKKDVPARKNVSKRKNRNRRHLCE